MFVKPISSFILSVLLTFRSLCILSVLLIFGLLVVGIHLNFKVGEEKPATRPWKRSILDFPPHIRMNILRHLLVSESSKMVDHKLSIIIDRNRIIWPLLKIYLGPCVVQPRIHMLAVLQSCRILYREGAQVFYGENQFVADNVFNLWDYTDVLSAYARARIRKVIILKDCLEIFPPKTSRYHEILRRRIPMDRWNQTDAEEALQVTMSRLRKVTHLTFHLPWKVRPSVMVYRGILELCRSAYFVESIEIERPFYYEWCRYGGPIFLSHANRRRLLRDAQETEKINKELQSRVQEKRAAQASDLILHFKTTKYLEERRAIAE